jgi:MATE family, multidrug efflux pump
MQERIDGRDDTMQSSASAIASEPLPSALAQARSDAPVGNVLGNLIAGPIIPTLLKLAAPTVVVLVVQTFVSVIETYFVGFLGKDALAGVALVFPVLMLMTMMSNGALGGGAASAVARALGSGRRQDANALVLHAVMLAMIFGLAFTIGVVGGGRALYRALGGSGEAIEAALQYSSFVFGGAVLIWVVNLLTASLRGAGDVRTPALVIFAGAVIVVPLSPALIFGVGPIPRLGIAGAGAAVIVYYVLASVALIAYMRSRRTPVRLVWARPQWRLFKDILGVGGISAIGTLQINITVAVATALVGPFGTDALAGYGMASRLDYLLIPLLFSLGTAATTMVGANIGARQIARARRIAWTAALLGAAVTETIGIFAALFPHLWIGIFSSDPNVVAAGSSYLHIVAPFYGFVGLGMLLYFAGQGARHVTWPVLAGTLRLIIVAAGGWLAISIAHADLTWLFATVAAAAVTFGSLTALAMQLQSWGATGETPQR